MNSRWLTALPVYNEVRYVDAVLDEVSEYSPEILVVDDGSTDGTGELLAARNDIHVVRHPQNRGYGAGLKTAFDFAGRNGYEYLVTIDCDGQHEPQRIPEFVGRVRSGRWILCPGAVTCSNSPVTADRRPTGSGSIGRSPTN